MHHRTLAIVMFGAALAAAGPPPAAAQWGPCCAPVPGYYGAGPVPLAYPPPGYVLNASDVRAPIYLVNQGPVYRGPNIYAVPTYSEGGYAFAPYPYVTSYPVGYGPSVAPYVSPSYRPYGPPPHGAYFRRPAPGARMIDMRRRYVHTPPRARHLRRGPHAAPSHAPIPFPPHAAPPTDMPPHMLPPTPAPRPEPGKPVDEQWTRGLPPGAL